MGRLNAIRILSNKTSAMRGGGEHGVDGVAAGVGKVIAAHAVMLLEMADDRLNGGTPFELALDLRRDAALLAARVDLQVDLMCREMVDTSLVCLVHFCIATAVVFFVFYSAAAWGLQNLVDGPIFFSGCLRGLRLDAVRRLRVFVPTSRSFRVLAF